MENIHHGEWMDNVMSKSDSDVMIFFDIDCVPMNENIVHSSIKYAMNRYLVGNAQVTNCVRAKHDLFCAPSFLTISRSLYEELGRPSCVNKNNSDVAQEITRSAVEKEKRIKMYFPETFQAVPAGGIWRLSGYGYYGVGTIFDGGIYHLFQSRTARNASLFVRTCEHIMNNRFDLIDRTHNCRSELCGTMPIEDDYG
jgi:hypothetical protein